MRPLFILFLASFLFYSCKSETDQNKDSKEGPMISQGENAISPDNQEANLVDVEVHPISHATAVLNLDGTIIYLDPTGGAQAFKGMEDPDFVLITDIHGDHLDQETLQALQLGETKIIAPQAVKDQLSEDIHGNLTVMANGETKEHKNISIEAIPMYNLREEAKQYHEKGRGNGYVLEKNGTRIYIAGDTEDIPEMRNLEDIDIAFIPMNLPYTMTVERAADAVLEFAPRKVYPYHFRGTEGKADVDRFQELVNDGDENIEVVMVDWYPEDAESE